MKIEELEQGIKFLDTNSKSWTVTKIIGEKLLECESDNGLYVFFNDEDFIQSSTIQEDDLTKSLNEIYKECEFDIDYFYKPLPPLMDCRQFNWELIEGEFKSINILDESKCVINSIHRKEIYTWGDDNKHGIYVGNKHSIFITSIFDHALTLILVRNNKQIK